MVRFGNLLFAGRGTGAHELVVRGLSILCCLGNEDIRESLLSSAHIYVLLYILITYNA